MLSGKAWVEIVLVGIAIAFVLILFCAPVVLPLLIGTTVGAILMAMMVIRAEPTRVDANDIAAGCAAIIIPILAGIAAAVWSGFYLWSPLVEFFYKPENLVISGIISGSVVFVVIFTVITMEICSLTKICLRTGQTTEQVAVVV
jgi:hypothetical protein